MQQTFIIRTMNKMLILLLATACIFNGCGSERITTISESSNVRTEQEENKTYKRTAAGNFMVVPIMYQQEYNDIPLGASTVAERGAAVTTLCMAISYATSNLIEPETFLTENAAYVNKDGTVDIEGVLKATSGLRYEKKTYDFQDMVNHLDEDNTTICVVEINHKSPYGKGLTYLILTGCTENGLICVRDPNLANKENNELGKTYYGESLYSTADVISAIGTESKAYYIFYGVSE